MRSFTYQSLPGRVVFGVGSIQRLPEEVERLGVKKVLVIADPLNVGLGEEVSERLGGMFVGMFSDVQQHVPAEIVSRLIDLARETGAEATVTIGGGSTTGFGKAVALDAEIPMIAVPTTYAGSEMTPIYGITSGGRKRVGRDLRVLPKAVIYDPALTTSLPPEVTGPSAMNALAHCVEALYAREANPITSLMAEEGIRATAAGLPVAVQEPQNLEARGQVLYGAYLAGASLAVVGMAIHHRVCHVLGGTFGLAHGDANAVILPHAARFNAEAAPDAMSRVARALDAEDAPTALFDLARSVGAPTNLAALGIKEEDLDEAARLVVESPPWNPRPVTLEDVRVLLDDAFHGRRPQPGREVVRGSVIGNG